MLSKTWNYEDDQLNATDVLPRAGAPSNCWIGGWMGFRAALNVVVKRKITALARS
jgi:hypothetical protein